LSTVSRCELSSGIRARDLSAAQDHDVEVPQQDGKGREERLMHGRTIFILSNLEGFLGKGRP
jgi:hypothetical protein